MAQQGKNIAVVRGEGIGMGTRQQTIGATTGINLHRYGPKERMTQSSRQVPDSPASQGKEKDSQ